MVFFAQVDSQKQSSKHMNWYDAACNLEAALRLMVRHICIRPKVSFSSSAVVICLQR